MGTTSFADEAALRAFHLARLERFLRLVDVCVGDEVREHSDLARRAAITAYCDCHESGAGGDAQRLMDRFLAVSPSWAKALVKSPRRSASRVRGARARRGGRPE